MANNFTNAPLSPTKTRGYVNNTSAIVGNASAEDDLLCYAYAQGYTDLVMYEMSSYISGGVFTNPAPWQAFITKAATYGIKIMAAFGGPSTAYAIIAWNQAYPATKFEALVTEVEWWNYSYNLPWQEPGTGAYSFYDSIIFLKNIYSQASAIGLKMHAYLGWVKTVNYAYESAFDILSINAVAKQITIRGDFTPTGEVNGRQFTVGQKIFAYYDPTKIYTITLIENIGGNTRLTVAETLDALLTTDEEISTYYDIIATNSIILPPTQASFIIRGDKTFRFGNLANSWARGRVISVTGSNGNDGIYNVVSVAYSSGANTTTIIVDDPLSSVTGGLFGFLNPDVVSGESESDFSIVGGLDGSEIEQLVPHIDEFWFHDYVTSTPRYNYMSSRLLLLGDGCRRYGVATSSTVLKDTAFIVSAEAAFSRAFFQGKDPNGNVIYTLKTPKNAYEYIVNGPYTAPPTSGNWARQITDADLNDYVTIVGIVIFHINHMRAGATGNGSRVFVSAGADQTLNAPTLPATTATTTITGRWCDDCLPTGQTYVKTWSIQSSPVGSAPSIAPVASPSPCSGTTQVVLTYDAPGTYVIRLTVTDGNQPTSVTSFDEVNIFVNRVNPPTLDWSIGVKSRPKCFNDCSGQIEVIYNTAPPSLTTAWQVVNSSGTLVASGSSTLTPPFLTFDIPNTATLCADTYTVTLVNGGITSTKTINLNSLFTPITGVMNIVNPLCFGNGVTNGTLTIVPSGGLPPYSYEWFDTISGSPIGNTTPSVTTNLSQALKVEVTDSNACVAEFIGQLNRPAPVAVVLATSVPATCGASNGLLIAAANGGTPPYTYEWVGYPAVTGPTLSGIAAGAYTVRAIDANGCASPYESFQLTGSAGVTGSISGSILVCNLNKNGETYTANTSSGTAPFTYLWSNGATTQSTVYSYANQAPGIRTITCIITDANGCQFTATLDIDVTTWLAPNPTIAVTDGALPITTCPGSFVELTASPGANGYWEFPGAIQVLTNPLSFNANDLNSIGINNTFDLYWTEIDTASGCQKAEKITVVYAPNISITVDAIGPNFCGNPAQVGFVEITVSGGCPPYTYQWSAANDPLFSETTQNIYNVPDDTYTVVVTDSQGDTGQDSFTVFTSFPQLSAIVSPAGCNGQASGSIDITVNGGSAPYTYLWSDGITTQDRNNLGAGIYSVTVTDDNGCTDTATYSIITSSPPQVDVTGTPPTGPGALNGTAIANPTGLAPFFYNWNTGATTQQISNLDYGTYTVSVKDASNCFAIDSITFVEPESDQIDTLKCCAASIAYKYVSQRRNGQWDQADCTLNSLILLNQYIKALCQNLGTSACLSDEDKRIITQKALQICGCCGCDSDPHDDTL